MKISIIIPMVNEQDQVAQSVERAWASGADEVIVVDGGSTDQTSDLAEGTDCVLVHSQPGRAIQMNSGAAVANGDIFIFLHADNWLPAGSCEQIRQTAESNEKLFGGFRQNIENKKCIFRLIEYGNELRLKWQGLVYGDQAMFIGKNLFEACGGFPEIELMEDFSLSYALKRFGKPVLLEGPTYVNARRWEKSGPLRQTAMNWFFAIAYRLGTSPKWIASRYRRHDK